MTTPAFLPESTVCSVEYTYQNQASNSTKGTGAIYGMAFPEGLSHIFFITSFQVLPVQKLEEVIGLRLVFKNEYGNLDLTPDWMKTLWSNEELGVTAIEFSKIAIDKLLKNLLPFNENPVIPRLLSDDAPHAPENVSLVSLQNGELIITKGTIDAINGSVNIDTEELIVKGTSISGSPILNEQNKVVGISCLIDHTNEQKAISIVAIFNAIRDEFVKRVKYLKNINSNEWLDCISKQYLTKKIIGCGGYGRVYKTTDPNGSTIALKEVSGFDSLDSFDIYKNESQALEKEFKLVKNLEAHPRIIQFYSFVRDDQNVRVFIVMEFLEAGSLQDKINSCGKLDKRSSLKYLTQILEGVCFLHENSTFHSDIKPANILLTENDDIKVCDFGISVAIQYRTQSSETSSHLKGNCYYMSPERINGASRSAKNDIWSVGATFVTMISGKTLNSNDKNLFPHTKIAKYELYIEDKPMKEYLNEIEKDDYRREIILVTLCPKKNRSDAKNLLKICQNLSSNSILNDLE